jgi:uncharacterized membrane protein YqjE
MHLTLLTAWLVVGIPVSYLLRQSITWLVILSVYAIVVGHWSAYSSERPTEVVHD